MGDVVGAPRGCVDDLLGDVFPGVDESAAGLDGLELLPGPLCQLFGEILDVPRPAGRVQHLPDV